MKILFIAKTDLSDLSPGVLRTSATLNFLRQNFSVEHIEFNATAEKREKQNSETRNKAFSIFRGINRSFRIIDRSCFSPTFFLCLLKIFSLTLKRQRYDIVYVSYKPAAVIWLGFIAKLLLAKSWVLEYRDLASQFSDRKIKQPWSFIDQYIEYFLVNFVSKIIVVSPTQKVEFEKAFSKPATLILNGVDKWHLANPIKYTPQRKLSVLYSGTLSERRNLEFLHDTKKQDIILEVFSNESVFEFGCPNDIQIKEHGLVPRESLKAKFSKCHAFLLLEGKTASSYANIPSKVFEYLSYKKPILFVGSSKSDVYRLLKPTGLLIFIENGMNLPLEIHKTKENLNFNFNQLHRDTQLVKLKKLLYEIAT